MQEHPVWFITGASRGFGARFARTALQHGARVVATARNPQAITDELGEDKNLCPLALDVTDSTQAHDAVDAALTRFGRIDVLVNNAGYGIFGALEEMSDNDIRRIFDTNVIGMITTTRAVLPIMRTQSAGRIVNMGSMASFASDPGGTLYDGTKAAIAAISEALSLEMAPFGIESMVVEPGMFRTNFFDRSSIKTPAHKIPAYDGTPARGAADYCIGHNYRQHGDPRLAAELVYDIVSSDDPLPLWLPLGKDSIKKFEEKLPRMVKSIEPYRERASNLFILE